MRPLERKSGPLWCVLNSHKKSHRHTKDGHGLTAGTTTGDRGTLIREAAGAAFFC